MGIEDVTPHQQSKPNDAPTKNAKPESSSPLTAKEDKALSPDMCSSRSASERGKETDPQMSKQGTEELKPLKAEQPSSAVMKKGESGQTSSSKKGSVGGSQGKADRWDPNKDDVWLHCISSQHHN